MSKNVTILKDSTADDAVKLVIETAYARRNSQAVTNLLNAVPYRPEYGWFRDMFWHIDSLTQYKFDDAGFEQIKTPERFLKDTTGDCDDYSTLWLSICYRLGLNAFPKIVKYNQDAFWDHIYVIVPIEGKRLIILDNVYGKYYKKFDVEVKFQDSKVFRTKQRNFFGVFKNEAASGMGSLQLQSLQGMGGLDPRLYKPRQKQSAQADAPTSKKVVMLTKLTSSGTQGSKMVRTKAVTALTLTSLTLLGVALSK